MLCLGSETRIIHIPKLFYSLLGGPLHGTTLNGQDCHFGAISCSTISLVSKLYICLIHQPQENNNLWSSVGRLVHFLSNKKYFFLLSFFFGLIPLFLAFFLVYILSPLFSCVIFSLVFPFTLLLPPPLCLDFILFIYYFFVFSYTPIVTCYVFSFNLPSSLFFLCISLFGVHYSSTWVNLTIIKSFVKFLTNTK